MRPIRLPSPRHLIARAPAFVGFAFGIILPLLLAGVFQAAVDGGLSDVRTPPEPAYSVL
jgi:hypothetical protein